MPRAGLTPERVTAEAEVLADEVGLDALTLAAVAKRLGVQLPSLYKHVSGLEALRRDLGIRAITELTDSLARAAVGRSGADALRALAGAYRAFALAHPGRYAAIQRAASPGDDVRAAAASALVRIIGDVLAGFGIPDDDMVDAIRALRASLHGFVILEIGGGFGLPVDVSRSYDRMVDRLVVGFS